MSLPSADSKCQSSYK